MLFSLVFDRCCISGMFIAPTFWGKSSKWGANSPHSRQSGGETFPPLCPIGGETVFAVFNFFHIVKMCIFLQTFYISSPIYQNFPCGAKTIILILVSEFRLLHIAFIVLVFLCALKNSKIKSSFQKWIFLKLKLIFGWSFEGRPWNFSYVAQNFSPAARPMLRLRQSRLRRALLLVAPPG